MRIGMVSTYPPRRCGLSAYAQELARALSREFEVVVCAVDRDGHTYGDEVVSVIRRDDADDYGRAARILAEHAVDAVVVQHAYGVFGGQAGSHLLGLCHELRLRGVPYLVTLHTAPTVASDAPVGLQEATVAAVTEGAATVIVLTQAARRFVESTVAGARPVAVIPHGVPPVAVSPHGATATAERAPQSTAGQRGSVRRSVAAVIEAVTGCRVLSTFGLIGPDKGVETAIAALPTVVADHPDVRFIIAGATDPDEERERGMAYREALQRTVDECGVAGRVHILDAYLSSAEVDALLGLTEIYLAPRLRPDRSSSGTLTRAVAAGCPVVAADHPYAREILGHDAGHVGAAGVVVPGADARAFGAALTRLLGDPTRLREAREAALTIGRGLGWPAIARRTAQVVREAVRVSVGGSRADQLVAPQLRLSHLRRLIDEIGVIRCAIGTDPDTASGYGVDEAGRLAIVAAGLLAQPMGVVGPAARATATEWVKTALRFLRAGMDHDGLRTRLGFSGAWAGGPHVGDHVGRALWAVGVVAGGPGMPSRQRADARAIRDDLAGFLVRTPGPPASAYAALGLSRDVLLSPRARAALAVAAARLDEAWGRGDELWRWFGDRLGPEAARLPQALIAGGRRLGDRDVVGHGLASLDWYARRVGLGAADGMLRFGAGDQAEDAGAVVEAFLEAYAATRARHYARLARRAFGWFLGANRLGEHVYDAGTGGCRDAVGSIRVDPNQGATATLAYHQALLALVEAELAVLPGGVPAVGELTSV